MILVGTNHDDLEGRKRLETLLNAVQPKKITFEAPAEPNFLLFKKKYDIFKKQVLAHVKARLINRDMRTFAEEFVNNYAYEVDSVLNYSLKTGAKAIPVDINYLKIHESYSKGIVARDAYIVKRSIEKYAERSKGDRKIANIRRLHQQKVNKSYREDNTEKILSPYIIKRDEIMSARVNKIMPDVHITGSGHLRDSPDSTYGLLKHLNPEIVLLCDVKDYIRKKAESEQTHSLFHHQNIHT